MAGAGGCFAKASGKAPNPRGGTSLDTRRWLLPATSLALARRFRQGYWLATGLKSIAGLDTRPPWLEAQTPFDVHHVAEQQRRRYRGIPGAQPGAMRWLEREDSNLRWPG